jgi:mono/diheme cytochrome c family protein/rhodanese-related sulfurtransferase
MPSWLVAVIACAALLLPCPSALAQSPAPNAPAPNAPAPSPPAPAPAPAPPPSAAPAPSAPAAPSAPPTASKPPAASASKASPPSGAALYARYCKLCHAADGSGYAADEAPSLVSRTFLETASDAFIESGIRFGRPGTAMGAYGSVRGGPLDDTQIRAITAFLRSKGPRARVLPEPGGKGDPSRGAALYARDCQECHGTPEAPGKAPKLYNAELLEAASPAFLRHAIVHGRPPTRMPAFEKKLSASEIDDVVAWLERLRPATPSARPAAGLVPDDLPLVVNPTGKAPQFTLRADRFVPAAQVLEALEQGRRLIVIDARSTSDWLQFHIPGALPIPYYDTQKLERIPNDGTWVVAYCACPHHASGEVVDALRRRGFPHTAVLDEGILDWRRRGYPLQGAAPATP